MSYLTYYAKKMNTSDSIKNLMYFNIAAAIILSIAMLYGLSSLNKEYEFGIPLSEYTEWQKALKGESDSVKTVTKDIQPDTITAKIAQKEEVVKPAQSTKPKPGEPIPSSKPPIVKPKPAVIKDSTPTPKPVETPKPVVVVSPNSTPSVTWVSGKKAPVLFFHAILFTLLSGALGGVLCNLRGIFKYNMTDQALLERLIGSYYMRPFMAAICGMFTYFVANLLVTAISVQPPIVSGVPFSAFIASIGLAMIAGFGSYEFMERLKETARTLFGGAAPKTDTEIQTELINQLKTFNELKKDKVISDEDFDNIKDKILEKLKTPDVNNTFLQRLKNPKD